MWTDTGKIDYKAPEMFTEGRYDKNVDMWSLGVVLFSLVFGYLPFADEKFFLYKNQLFF